MKDILEFHVNKDSNSEIKRTGLPKRSDLEVGEQRNRGYKMPIDKDKFCFGEVRKKEQESVANCINAPQFNPAINTEFEQKNVEAIRLNKHAPAFQSTTNKLAYKN
jgi:hypothetical protein